MWLITLNGTSQSPTLCKTPVDVALYIKRFPGELFEIQYIEIFEEEVQEELPVIKIKSNYVPPEPLSGDSE